MRRLFWQVSVTLDGFMEGPGHDLTRTAQVVDEDFERYCSGMLQSIDGFVVGRRTYELFVGHWPTATGPDAERLNELPKLVGSRTLRAVAWRNARLAGDDVVLEVEAWKRQPGRDLALFGSADLAATLLARGLVDELRLLVTPFLLGSGTPLFRGDPVDLRLVDATRWSSGVMALTYAPGLR